MTFPFFEGSTISSTSSSAQGGAAHELGHVFGLPHEFLNDDNFNGNMMGNGLRGFRGFLHPRRYPADDVRISGPSALQLLTNRFFNADKVYTDNTRPTVEILSDGVVTPEKGLLHVRFRAADAESDLASAVLLRSGNAVGELLLTGRDTETAISTYSYDVGVTEQWAIIAYDAQGNRTLSAPVTLTPAAGFNRAPIPFVRIDRRRITAGESVTVDAGSSSDPDDPSSPLHVEWDLNGDRTFDTQPSTDMTRTVTFAEPGTYQVFARLTDGAGDSSISTQMGVRVDPRVVNGLVGFEQTPSTPTFTPDATGCPSGYAGRFSFGTILRNMSQQRLSNLRLEVLTLTDGNLLLAGNELFGEQDLVDTPDLQSRELLAGEAVDVPLTVCLEKKQQFQLFVNVRGTAQ